MVSLYKSIFCISLRTSRWKIIISIGSIYFVFQSIVNVLRHNSVSGNLVWRMCLWQVISKRDANDPCLLGFILLCNPLPLSVVGLVTHCLFFFNFGCVESLVRCMGFSSPGSQAFSPSGVSDLSCSTRDQTHAPWTARWILNRWATREVLWLTSIQQRITKVMGCYFYD